MPRRFTYFRLSVGTGASVVGAAAVVVGAAAEVVVPAAVLVPTAIVVALTSDEAGDGLCRIRPIP